MSCIVLLPPAGAIQYVYDSVFLEIRVSHQNQCCGLT